MYEHGYKDFNEIFIPVHRTQFQVVLLAALSSSSSLTFGLDTPVSSGSRMCLPADISISSNLITGLVHCEVRT